MANHAATDAVMYTIEAPPESVFPTEAEAEAAIHTWTKEHKFNVSRSQLQRNEDGGVRYRLFACDQAGQLKNTRKLQEADRQRPMRRSKRNGCKMRISIVAVDDKHPEGSWQIRYTRDGSCTHNHPPSEDVRVHFVHRQRDARMSIKARTMSTNDLIEAQTAAGVTTEKIYATLNLRDESSLVLPKDIANAKGAVRNKLLASQTSNEALMSLLQEKGFHYAYESDSDTKRLKYLLWAHPKTTDLARHFMDVLVLDCTYKTNRYNLPLLNAIILTGINTVLPFAQIWMPGEAEPDFTWAFNKLKELMETHTIDEPRVIVTDRDLACTNATEVVFPKSAKMLCRWHVRRNVHAQAKKKIGLLEGKNSLSKEIFMAQFGATVDATTEQEFNEKAARLRDLSGDMADYLDRHWWPHKHKIVRCWTDRYCHFGC